jgi:hypothetical protein
MSDAVIPKPEKPEEYAIIAGWLCAVTDECTCGSGGFSQHEQYCGVTNIVQVDKLLDEYEKSRVALMAAETLALRWQEWHEPWPPDAIEGAVLKARRACAQELSEVLG